MSRRRATFYSAWREKELRNVFLTATGNSEKAASHVGEFIYSKGAYAYGGDPDIDQLFEQQAAERGRATRETWLHCIQQLTMERVMFGPIRDLLALIGVGPRLAKHTINSISMHPFPSMEDMRLKQP
jgi:peptide/nickel transport system substrate-binding protein